MLNQIIFQPRVSTRSLRDDTLRFLKAQCNFRGLSTEGRRDKITLLRKRLADGEDEPMTELLNNHLDVSPSELADRDPQHFLSQTFDIHDRAKDKSSTLIVAVRKDSALLQHARGQRLHCEEAKAPNSYIKDPRYPYMVLIARFEPDLSNNQEWNELMKKMEQAEKDEMKAERVLRETGQGDEWHVSGAYELPALYSRSCPVTMLSSWRYTVKALVRVLSYLQSLISGF